MRPKQQRLVNSAQPEELLDEQGPSQVYPYGTYPSRITDLRPTSSRTVPGAAERAQRDLRPLIEKRTDSVGFSAEGADRRVFTSEQLSARFNVSTKTISRWREYGLEGHRFVLDGQERLGFLESSVDRFVAANPHRIRRGRQFSHLTDQERDTMIQLARDMATVGDCPTDIFKKVARQTGRSVEAVRYTIKRYDQRHPERAVLAHVRGRLSTEEKKEIYRQYRCGVSPKSLAKRFARSPMYVRRLIRHMRLQRVKRLTLDYIPNPEFDRPDAAQHILVPMPQAEPSRPAGCPRGVPSYLAGLYDVPLLTREQEAHLFRKFNFLKYRAGQQREQLATTRPSFRLLDEIEELYDRALKTKNHIVQANLRLVVSIAKRYAGQAEFYDLVSDGNMSLIGAVEKFDYSFGNKFSTYATWAVKRSFARSFITQIRHRERFHTGQDERLGAETDHRLDPHVLERDQRQREGQLRNLFRCLDPRERQIVTSRFGLARGQEPKTLREVGSELGVSKERIRQIESQAIRKLRQAAEHHPVDSPAA